MDEFAAGVDLMSEIRGVPARNVAVLSEEPRLTRRTEQRPIYENGTRWRRFGHTVTIMGTLIGTVMVATRDDR